MLSVLLPVAEVAVVERVVGLSVGLPSQEKETELLVVESQRPAVLSVLRAALVSVQQQVLVLVLVLRLVLLVDSPAHTPTDMVAEQLLGNLLVPAVGTDLEDILQLQARPAEREEHIAGIQELRRWVSVLHQGPEAVLQMGLLPVSVVQVKLRNGKLMRLLLGLVLILLLLYSLQNSHLHSLFLFSQDCQARQEQPALLEGR